MQTNILIFGSFMNIVTAGADDKFYPHQYQQDEKITCYECSYTKYSNGPITGNENCIEVDKSTGTITANKYDIESGLTFRHDCTHRVISGTFKVTGSAADQTVTFTSITRGMVNNFNDTDTYIYEGVKADMEYRVHQQKCGQNIDACSQPVSFPIQPSAVTSILQENVPCYQCRRIRTFLSDIKAWVDVTPDRSCDTLDPPPKDSQTCSGQCTVIVEEYKNGNEDFRRDVQRYCQPMSHAQPDVHANEKIAEMKPNYLLCQTDLCNSHNTISHGTTCYVMFILIFSIQLLFVC